MVHAAGDVAALAALLNPDGRLVSALGATAEQAGLDDITVTGVMAVAEPEKFAALLASVAAGDAAGTGRPHLSAGSGHSGAGRLQRA